MGGAQTRCNEISPRGSSRPSVKSIGFSDAPEFTDREIELDQRARVHIVYAKRTPDADDAFNSSVVISRFRRIASVRECNAVVPRA